ncbi:MAG: gamma-glutamyl-gamma-aminobutyrate hydrolase family protein [Anaerolineae bacterium]
MKQPLIGIPAYFDTSLPETMPSRFAMSRPYITALEAAGALPVILPLALGETTLRALYERLDGLFMAGGGDLNPECYRQYRHPATNGIDDLRDQSEITLLRWALSDDMPILGVCRGSQALNVAAGGTLVQDIADQMPRALRHQWHPEKSRDFVAHDIELPYDSRLASILGKTAHVNSFHHQAVDQIAVGLRAVAFAPDGVVEAVEHPDKDFCIGVQWHPEGLIFQDDSMRRLFEVFVGHSRRKIA